MDHSKVSETQVTTQVLWLFVWRWIGAHHRRSQGSYLPPLITTHTHCSIALRGEEERLECSYIMANALRPCAVSAGRWCVAQHSRANGQIEQGGDWRRVEVCGETRDGACSHRSARGGGGVTEEGSANPAANCHRFTASLVNSAASLTLQLGFLLTLFNHFLAAHQLFLAFNSLTTSEFKGPMCTT